MKLQEWGLRKKPVFDCWGSQSGGLSNGLRWTGHTWQAQTPSTLSSTKNQPYVNHPKAA